MRMFRVSWHTYARYDGDPSFIPKVFFPSNLSESKRQERTLKIEAAKNKNIFRSTPTRDETKKKKRFSRRCFDL